ncbi:M15 family metallopeptidase [Priestia aryabhattai]|uniref:M15 family metallopeptidase n=1 Tax=Priestia aryabhattai TaxID=412384 RepID=UPI00203F4F8D|nr:M15 family metallopeptidase [Priestia aryabhattai]MCM3770766.1 M15 family metallopeptidase [Priestia aryabhattai]
MKYFLFIGFLAFTLMITGCGTVNSSSKPARESNENGQAQKLAISSASSSLKKPNLEETVVIANPESVTALVNKKHQLPESYQPSDLVYADVPFIFSEKIEKRMLRKPAAQALEELFQDAGKAGISLLGVSGYRSHERQKKLFVFYAKRDGEEKASTYSAYPGTSEHETGLAIDVTGGNGICAAADCFADTPEARWLSKNAYQYGFIIRYPAGEEQVTGYKYEPWHLRYVGKKAAASIFNQYVTLENYASKKKDQSKVL